jgi:hypothetical protein
MCGDLEEEAGSQEEEFHGRFIAHAQSFLASLKAKAKSQDPVHTHLDRLFRELLSGAADANKMPDEMTGFQRLTMEPLVFARLAGFIAAHVPLSEDPLRRIMEAMMLGYSEGEIEAPVHDHDHGHDHGHDHDHDHGHGHSH